MDVIDSTNALAYCLSAVKHSNNGSNRQYKRSSLLPYTSYDSSENIFTTMEVNDIEKPPTLQHC
jgi:hypothetical protein